MAINILFIRACLFTFYVKSVYKLCKGTTLQTTDHRPQTKDTHTHIYTHTHIHTYRHTDRQTDRETGRQTGRQTDRTD